jgi:hypothetical protein
MIAWLLMAAAGTAAPNSIDSAAALRVEVAPYVRCDRQFDRERWALLSELDGHYAVANRASDDQRLDFNWETNRTLRALNGQLGALEAKIQDVCKQDEIKQKLAAKISKIRQGYRAWDIYSLAHDFFQTNVSLERQLAGFKAGHFRAPDPPSAPPPLKSVK